MADNKSHPPSKPNPPPPFPASKAPPFNRPFYQPQPPFPSSSKRRSCCFSLLLALLSLILLAVIAGGILYAVYRPRRPSFSISTVRLSALNATARLDITVTARNPNRRIAYSYDPISVSVSSDGVGIGEASFPGFVQGAKNITVMSSTASPDLDLRRRTVPLEFYMETKAGIRVGGLKTKRVGMKVYCGGIEIAAPKGKKAEPAAIVDRSCRVELRMKIWKWTI